MKDKSLLLPVHPRFARMIIEGEKPLELRTRIPSMNPPYRVYIYETKAPSEIPWCDEEGHMIFQGRGKIIGECLCTRVFYLDYDSVGGLYYDNGEVMYIDDEMDDGYFQFSRVTRGELLKYTHGKRPHGLWLVSPSIYAKPLNLSDFGVTRAPQSWRYVDRIPTPTTIPF